MGRVEVTAREVAHDLGLFPEWFNSMVQIRRDSLPEGWMRRRIFLCGASPLSIYAASRIDLLAMKVLAGRKQDIEDIEAMKPRADDLEFLNDFFKGLHARGTPEDQILKARGLAGGLRLYRE